MRRPPPAREFHAQEGLTPGEGGKPSTELEDVLEGLVADVDA
jgi:hypothetical protein